MLAAQCDFSKNIQCELIDIMNYWVLISGFEREMACRPSVSAKASN